MTRDLRHTESWSELVARLPDELDLSSTAREFGAFERPRGVRSAEDLLRLALIYGSGLSLRGTAAWASACGLAALSDVALLLRLQGCCTWLEALVCGLLSRAVGPACEPRALALERRVRLIDATVLSGPGTERGGWRLHADYDLAACRFVGFELSDRHGSESLARFAPAAGDLFVGDRYYAKADQLAHVVAQGADFLVRRGLTSCRLQHGDGRALDMVRLIAELRPERDLDLPVLVPLGAGRAPLQARLIVRHIGAERAAEARRRARRKAAKNGQTASQKRLKAAEYVMLLSSMTPEQASAEELFEIYRLRWQIELAFKRLKSLMGFDRLNAKDPRLVRSCLYAKLILALITEDLTTRLLDSFPSAPGRTAAVNLAPPAARLPAAHNPDPRPPEP